MLLDIHLYGGNRIGCEVYLVCSCYLYEAFFANSFCALSCDFPKQLFAVEIFDFAW